MKTIRTLCLALLLPAGALHAADAPRPNIVYLLADDLGRADVGFMGSKEIRTPNLDKLAREGAILDAYYVQPVCSPTRAALLTGRYATHTGVYTIVRPNSQWGLGLEERTLAQALAGAGYSTAICGKWHLGEFEKAYRPTQRGFAHQYGFYFGMIDYYTHKRVGQADWYRDDQPLVEPGYSTHLIAKDACQVIRDQPADKPLFLYVPFNGVHAPHQVPEEYANAYPDLKGVRRTMAGMISAVDEAVGQIVAALEEKGMRKNTLIIFSSDNGGPGPGVVTLNTPLRAGKGTIYEGGVRVCAFATWPGQIAAGTTIREPIHAVDWYPTLLRLAGASLEQKLPLDGLDIWPTLTQGAKSPHDAILLVGSVSAISAVRMGDWKLLMDPNENDAEETAESGAAGRAYQPSGKVELYNLAEDIGEKNNLAAANPAKVKEMRARMDALLKGAVPVPGNSGRARRGR